MGLFSINENRIKCGNCNTEFDLNKNDGCPLCLFGNSAKNTRKSSIQPSGTVKINKSALLSIPPKGSYDFGKVVKSPQTEVFGGMMMFNSFFPGKAIIRIAANMMAERGIKKINLEELIDRSAVIIKSAGLSKYRGFPNNPKKDSSLSRLFHHFIRTFHEMGMINITSEVESSADVWGQNWSKLNCSVTQQGFEFACLKNTLFDTGDDNQVLTNEEVNWMIRYLKQIAKSGYNEYYILNDVYNFLKEGNNGKDDLWNWFKSKKSFINYVRTSSRKSNDEKAFSSQIDNLTSTLGTSKLALLRELSVIKNKRDDYTIISQFK